MSLELNLHERQGQALLSPATEILYGGAAGGGKSHLMRVAAILWALEVPGLQIYLFRRTFPELMRNHMEGLSGFPALLQPLVEEKQAQIVKQEIRFSNGSKIFLNHLQHAKDMHKFLGAEIHVLLIDELTLFPEDVYRFLRGRCRLGGLKIPERWAHKFPCAMSGTNPGGVGHTWVKRSFVNAGALNLWRTPKAEGGMLRQYIPATLSDNPTLTDNDPDYEDRLDGLGDPSLVRAMKEGDWDIVAGAAFDEFRQSTHMTERFPVPHEWPVWRGADDGFASPAAVVWLARDPFYNITYVIDELEKTKMDSNEFAERVLRKDAEILRIDEDGRTFRNEEKLTGVMDSASFAMTGAANSSRGAQMNKLGCNWTKCKKSPNGRVLDKQNIHRMLRPLPSHPMDSPGLIIFDNCRRFLEQFPALPVDKHNVEDVDTNAEDHLYDALRYGLQKSGKNSGTVKIAGI